jgi:beta-lactam-binding protein with PASTA domain
MENRDEGNKPNLFLRPRIFFSLCAGMIVCAVLIALAVFFLSVRGAEEVMVPDVQNKEIVQALIELQNKELYPRVQLRFSQNAADKGHILEQDPKAGAIVKAGRRIRLVVSQGVLISAIGSYTGRDIGDVRDELAALFGSSDIPLITIKEPLLYQFSNEEPGTILEQDPAAGTGISSQTEISLVVSRGSQALDVEMPMLMGLKTAEAVNQLIDLGIRFEISLRNAASISSEGTIVSQTPAGGDAIPEDGIAELVVAAPKSENLSKEEIAGLYTRTLPDNPYPLQTTLEVILPSGEKQTIVDMSFKGGKFTYPYRVQRGSILVLSLLGREIHRQTVE